MNDVSMLLYSIFVLWSIFSGLLGCAAYISPHRPYSKDEIMKFWILPFDIITYPETTIDGMLSTFSHLTIIGKIFYSLIILFLDLYPYIMAEIAHIIYRSMYFICVKQDKKED